MSGFMSKLQKLSPKRSRDRTEYSQDPHTYKQSHKPSGRLPGKSSTLPPTPSPRYESSKSDASERARRSSDNTYIYTEQDEKRENNPRSPLDRSGARLGQKPPVKSKPRRYDRSQSEASLSDSGSVSSLSERIVPQRYKPGRRLSETSADSDVFETSSPTLTKHTVEDNSPKQLTTAKSSSMRRGNSMDSIGVGLDWKSKPIDHWTTDDVVEWSSSLGIDKLTQIFRNAGITGSHLANITDEILVDLGLRSIVDRRKFLAEVKSVTGRKLSSLWTLKQVSMKRRNLEKSTDKLCANLETLQKLNEEQEKMISTSLYEIQQEQLEAEELLTKEKTQDTSQESNNPDQSPIHIKLSKWSTDDVVRWLDNNGLAHFVSVFQDNHIAGKDLDDENLNFLDHLDGFDIEAREALLSAIYKLQNPEPVSTQENDLQKILTDEDRQKYLVALQVAALEQSSMTGSMTSGSTSTLDRSTGSLAGSTSTLYVGNLMGSLAKLDGSTNTLASPQSETYSQGTQLTEPGKHALKRSSPRRTNVYRKNNSTSSQEQVVQKRNSNPISKEVGSRLSQSASGDSSLYKQLGTNQPVCVVCVRIALLNHQLGFTVTVPERGKVIVSHINNSSLPLHKGDRLLEVCAVSLARVDTEEDFYLVVNEKTSLNLVVMRDTDKTALSKAVDGLDIQETHLLQDKLTHSENQWRELRQVLEELRDMDVDSDEYLNIFPITKVEAVKDMYKLQEQLQQLQTTLTNQVTRANATQNELETKECALKLAEEERDRAVTKLHQLVSIIDTDNRGLSYEELDDTLPLWENLRSASKEDILQALKDTIVETTRQKAYLDHLLGVVIEQAPYLLDELDDVEGPEEITPTAVTTQLPEEWC